MLGTHLLASATALMRSQILPPSEMKSLYDDEKCRDLFVKFQICHVLNFHASISCETHAVVRVK
jgi:hypothetical protein